MNRRTWLGSAAASLLTWLGLKKPAQAADVGKHGCIRDMVVNKDPVIIFCLPPPQVKVYNAYIEQVCRYLEHDFTHDPYVPPDECFMRTIEDAVNDYGIHEAMIDDFRRQVMQEIGTNHWRGKASDFDHAFSCLKEAIEKVVAAHPDLDALLPKPDMSFAMPKPYGPADYDGFPVRYPHWKWGTDYEELSREHPQT